MPFTLKLRPSDVTPVGEAASRPGRLVEEDLGKVGFTLASNEFPDAYRFSRMGGWSPTFRASVIRISLFKLFGTGVAAAFLSLSSNIGRYTSWSLAMSAAVNLVACSHYYYICECLRLNRAP